VIPVLLLNQAARDVAATGLLWPVVVIASLQCLVGLGGLGLCAHAAWRDRRR
jgi:hypothetical protein